VSSENTQILFFTLSVSLLSTILILPAGVGLAWWLSRYRGAYKSIVETLVALPLVMPPVATGFILLKFLGRHGWAGELLHRFGLEIIFTWRAVVIALAVMSFPLLVRSAQTAFESVNPRLEKMARTLGAGPWRVFFTITLPLASHGIIAGSVLAFARALGEFGATILIAGNIPGKTATLSLSIYQLIQLGNDEDAFRLLTISIFLSFAAVWLSRWFLKRNRVS
jgi:molybdate transport system permease protein